MMKKRKKTLKDFELEPTPVWVTNEMGLEPSPFFKNWWQKVAEQRYGNKERWLDVAIQLGYVWEFREPYTGQICHDPVGFDYDPSIYRKSLNLNLDMPLVREDDSRKGEYSNLWELLLSEDNEEDSGG